MADDITQKHLARTRVRGAPTTIPGSAGMVGSYAFKEVPRSTMRALALDLPPTWDAARVREGQQKLAQTAAVQGLVVLEPPMLALLSNPMEDVPHEWKWELLLPIRGRAQPDEAATIRVTRLFGGMYLESHTTKGARDLGNLYTYFLGQLMPARSQELVRPVIYHRITDGLDVGDLDALTIEVLIPFFFSLKQQPRLVTREEMT